MDDERGLGWLTFAATLLIFTGVMRFFDAIWAFRYDGSLPDHLSDSVFGDNLTTYGWISLVVAAILIFAGFGVLSRMQFARWIGIIAAGIAGLSAITWVWYYPIWSLIYVILAVMIMYALIIYGGREPAREN
jgi:hypothetical protein